MLNNIVLGVVLISAIAFFAYIAWHTANTMKDDHKGD